MSDRKFTDHIFVNGEQRFFVASEVTDELLARLEEEFGHLFKGVVYISTQNTFDEVVAILNEGNLPVLKHEFAEDDFWYLALKEADIDNSYLRFSGPTSPQGVFAFAELCPTGWVTPPETRSLHREIFPLVLTKNGRTVGAYNPLVDGPPLDIPNDAVVLNFDPSGWGKMSAETYQKMHDALWNDQDVILRSSTGSSASYWQPSGSNSGGYRFVRVGSDSILIASIAIAADSSGDHQITVTSFDFDVDPFHEEGNFNTKTSVANTKLDLFSVDVPDDGVYIVSLLCHIRPTALAGTKSEVIFSIEGPDGTGLPNTTRSNLVDDSDGFDQPFEITVILELKAGTNTVKALFTGAYQVFGDRWSVTSIKAGGGGGGLPIPEEIEKLLADLDTKLNTSMDMGDIVDCYDMASNSNGVNGNLLGFAFTVPINSPIRLSDTKIGVYAKQNYSTKVIIGLYEYNFEGNNGAGQTLWVCDTGPVSIMAGRNEFPVTHLRTTDQELKSDRVYYASIYFPSGKSLGCYLAGKPGYDNTVNARPQFTLGADNITLDITDLNATLEDTGFWASGYNERPSIPRFLMQIRNKESGDQPQSGPFDNLASFELAFRTLGQMGFTSQPLNNGIVFKKVVPREAVTIKKWKWIDDQSNGEWGHGWRVCDGTMGQLVNSSSEVTFTNAENGNGTYTHTATHSTGLQLQAETVYWFPVQGNTSNILNSVVGGYVGDKHDDLRCCQSGYNIQWGPSWDLNSSNAYLYLEDDNGNGWTI